MVGLIISWLLSAVGLLGVVFLFPGFRISDFESALIVVLLVGLISSIFGLLLKLANGWGTLATLAIFLVLFDGCVFRVTALLVPGFAMLGFAPAFGGAMVLILLQTALRIVAVRAANFHSQESLLHS